VKWRNENHGGGEDNEKRRWRNDINNVIEKQAAWRGVTAANKGEKMAKRRRRAIIKKTTAKRRKRNVSMRRKYRNGGNKLKWWHQRRRK
jgi:hypothetical protein